MSGITMCTQSLCPNAGSCLRVRAEPSAWQSFSDFKYEIGKDGVICDHYLPFRVFVEEKKFSMEEE